MPPKTIKPKVAVKTTKVVAKVQPKPKKPIVTTNPRDPRIKSYKDSLDVYNIYKKREGIVKSSKLNPKDNRSWGDLQSNTGNSVPYKYGKIEPIGSKFIDVGKDYPRIMITEYKKPTTPVVYKKAEPKVVKPEPKPTVKTTPVKKEVGKENTKVRLSPKGEASKKSVDSLKNIGYGRAIGNSYKEKTGNMETYGPDASDKIKKLLNKTKKQ